MRNSAASPLRLAVAGMTGMAMAMGIGRFVYTPLLPGMMDELSLSASDAGLIASANYLGYLVGAIVASGGWAGGRERAVMLTGLAASAVFCAAMAMTHNLALFMAIRFLAGVASAFLMIFLSTIVFGHLVEHGRADLQALHFGGVGIGIALSAIMTAGLVVTYSPWTSGWVWSAIISGAGFVIVALAIDRGPAAGAGSVRREPPLPKDPDLLRLIIAYGLFGFGYVITATFLVAIVRDEAGGRLFEAAVWLATGLAGFPSVYFWNFFARRLGMNRIFAVACIVEAVGVAASVTLGGQAGPLIGGILLGGTFIAITAIGLQIGRLMTPKSPRRTLALMTAAFGLGQITGPIMAGYVADWTGGFAVSSLVAALALFICAGLTLSMRTRL
jgi:predicted MFS family arabinose efflux permease